MAYPPIAKLEPARRHPRVYVHRYWWETGMGERYAGEEDFCATSTAILARANICRIWSALDEQTIEKEVQRCGHRGRWGWGCRGRCPCRSLDMAVDVRIDVGFDVDVDVDVDVGLGAARD